MATYCVDKRTYAIGRLTSNNTNVSDADTVTIGSKVYTFKTNLTPLEGEIKIGATADASLLNLSRAINHTGTPDTDYKCAAANSNVSAGQFVANVWTLDSIDTGNHRFWVLALLPGGIGRCTYAKSAATLTWTSGTGLQSGDGGDSGVTSTIYGTSVYNQAQTINGTGAYCDLLGYTEFNTAGDHTFNIYPLTGGVSYLSTDCTSATGTGYIYFINGNINTITTNWNGNYFKFDKNFNDGTYEWHQSTGLPGTYYLTATGGANPSLVQVQSCVIDGYWSAASTNLTNVGFTLYGHYATHNWSWGDHDTLGFNTLYIKYPGGNPTGKSIQIWANYPNYSYMIRNGVAAKTTFVFNDGRFTVCSKTNGEQLYCTTPFKFNRCLFYNSDFHAVNVANAGATGSESNYCKYINCGHRGVNISAQCDFIGYNNYFENVHLAVLISSNTAYTVTLKNNSSKNLLAGFIQHDNATPTLVESNNQIHLDPDSTHAGQAIAYTAGVSQCAITDATDLPPATATTATTGVDSSTFSNGTQVFSSGVKVGKPLAGSPLLNAGVDLSMTGDFDSVAPDATPNIGAYEGFISGGGGLSPGLGLSGGNRPPWWNRRR